MSINSEQITAEASPQQGQVYFIRHGESTSNERNIFAGVLDVDLTAITPIALIVTFRLAKQLPINSASLQFFLVILGVGLAIPGAIAQFWRSKSPVESNHHSKNWKFIGVLTVALMSLITGFKFTQMAVRR